MALISEKVATTNAAIATGFSTLTTNADTGARTLNVTAIRAQIVALGQYAIASKAALGAIGVAALALIAIYTALQKTEEKRQKEALALQEETTKYQQTDAELFLETLNNQELALDDIIGKYENAKAAVKEYAGATTEQGKKLRDDAGKDMATYGDVAEVRLAGLLKEGEITREEIEKVTEALDTISRGRNLTPIGPTGRFMEDLFGPTANPAFDEAEKTKAEFADLVEFIRISGVEGVDAIEAAINSNAASLNAFMNDSNEYVNGLAGAMESATQSVLEFNNAREELFYGMAASNITGDLVRQVVNRGVENLLVNTEVIMTNNFNGMTTEQAAQEILDHVERGARMRGVDMSTVSQSIQREINNGTHSHR